MQLNKPKSMELKISGREFKNCCTLLRGFKPTRRETQTYTQSFLYITFFSVVPYRWVITLRSLILHTSKECNVKGTDK